MTQDMDSIAGNDPAADMKRLMLEVAKLLVDDPGTVDVQALPDGEGTILRLRVASTDLGKVIGRQGRTARSLRTILGAAGMKLRHRFSLDIVEGPSSGAVSDGNALQAGHSETEVS